MGTTTTVFLIGATGYIGGAVLARLLEEKKYALPKTHITVLTRSGEKARRLRAFGLEPVVGSLDDLKTLEEIATKSDVVIQCADADHMRANKAILGGLRKRHEASGTTPILIHTSGTAVLSDNARGMHGTDTIYYDSDPDQLETIPLTQPHRDVDLNIVAADKEGYVKTFIVLPSTVYGIASNPLVDAGIANPQSMQIPKLIEASIDRRQAGMVGLGINVHPNVHIDDLADLYRVILDAALAGQQIGHGREGFYFGENGEHTLYQIAEAIGCALQELRLADNATPSTFTKHELDKYFAGSESLGTNVRCRGERSRAIGWRPTMTATDLLKSIKPEIEYILARRS
ncbi:NAD-P-binding protein [Earliella scabrosa]|nr:NAD-P-binding protein [Earliella scabrosa]